MGWLNMGLQLMGWVSSGRCWPVYQLLVEHRLISIQIIGFVGGWCSWRTAGFDLHVPGEAGECFTADCTAKSIA